MLVSDIFTQVQDHGFTDLTNAQLFFMLNDGVQDFNSLQPWPHAVKTVTTAYTTSQATQFASTTDIKQVLSINNSTTLVNLMPARADTVLKTYGVYSPTLVGTPYCYYVDGVNAAVPNGLVVKVYPAPSTADTIVLRYIKIVPQLTLTTDLIPFPERFHRLMVLATLVRAYRMEDDFESAQVMENMYDRQVQRATTDLWDTNYDRPDYVYDVYSESDGFY